MSLTRTATLPLRYLWAAPVTLIGLSLLPLTVVTGGKLRVERGALEMHGGFARFVLRRCLMIEASALCLGHVILGQDRDALDHSRDHEHVHVRQCERWGPLFIPAYFLSSYFAWRRGEHFYFDNRFEREAFGLDQKKFSRPPQSGDDDGESLAGAGCRS